MATNQDVCGAGISIGFALAAILSYLKWQDLLLAVLHGCLSWIYVVYYILKYGWPHIPH